MSNKIIFHPSVIESAISLKDLGINELAWKWEDVHIVIDYLVENKYAILGGDVYLLQGDEKIVTYDSWYLDRDTGTSWLDYVIKSKETADEYINSYHMKNGDNYCYSIIYSKNE
ncbi:immunity 40 family protein [Sutcliffiella horikoshii]|uniref:Imm40 family immunity protein n=1 Tax=Sutcliffiella horikoshii TaxID=79883 RepID=UPI00384E8D40